MWPFSSRRRLKEYGPELLLQQLEDRVVLDAAVNPTPQDNPSNNSANPQDHLNPTDTPAKTLGLDAGPTGGAGLVATLPDSYHQVFNNDLNVVLVANNLADVQAISNAAPDDSKVIVYDAQHDNLATITTMLQDLVSVTGHKIDNLAIVGHGTEGSLNVGTDQIQFFSLANHRGTFEALGQTLSQDAQIQLYGCYVAEDVFGQALIDRVAIYTTADVFASTDSTGGAQHDWTLEYSSDPDASMEILLSPDKLSGIESELGFWMVKDINPVDSSVPVSGDVEMVNIGGTIFFIADDGTYGSELWRTDGTADGTQMVKDINPTGDAFAADWSGMVNVNGILFFEATDGVNGYELWKSDGTSGGTVMVRDINPDSGMSGFAEGLTNFNGTLFFVANDGTLGFEGWRSDGTISGTVMVKDINPTGDAFNPYWSGPAVVNGNIFFEATDGVNGYELWKSDGTSGGTSMVKDINPNAADGWAESLTNVNDTLYFVADDGVNGYELWKSDGTAGNTALVKDINPGSGLSAYPQGLANVNGILVFTANDGVNGYEPWMSDGTVSGTVMVKDINPGVAGSFNPMTDWPPVVNVNGVPFFVADDGTNGAELWTSDGTPSGTQMVKDIYPGLAGSGIEGIVAPIAGTTTAIIGANDGTHGTEPWRSDGTSAGTFMVGDINTGSGSSFPMAPVWKPETQTLLFYADDGTHGHELWAWSNDAPTATEPIGDVTVEQDAPDTVFSLYPYFQDVEDADAQLTYTVTGNTNPALFTAVNITDPTNFRLDYAPGTSGSADITIRATDIGGLFVEDTLHVTVNPAVNTAPTVTAPVPDVAVNEDAADNVFSLYPYFQDVEDADALLTYTVTGNTDPSLFTLVNFTDPNNFTLDYAPDANGIADITIRATDTGGFWVEDTFNVTVNPVNDDPTVQVAIPDVTVDEDDADTVFSLYPYFQDVEDADAQLVYTVEGNTNPSLFALVNITDPTNFTLDYAPDANGTAEITIRANDTGGLWVEDTFTVTVNPVNDDPTVQVTIPDVTVDEDAADTVFSLYQYFQDVEDTDNQLVYTVEGNTNSSLFTSVSITDPTSFTLNYAPDATGTADITIRATDTGGLWVEDTFNVTVNPVNDNPTVEAVIPDVMVDEDAADSVFSLYPYFRDVENTDAQLVYSLEGNTNPSLFTLVNITDPTNFRLNYATDANGTADIIIRATDTGGLWVENTFTVTVNPVNDNPTVQAAIPNVTVDEDAADTMFSLYPYFQDVEDSDAQLVYSVEGNTNPSLFTSVNITDPTNFTVDYAPGTSGSSDITIRATDIGGLFVEDTFHVLVNSAVNTAPTLTTPVPDVTVDEDAADTVFSLYPYFEDAENTDAQLTYTVTGNTNPALFTSVNIADPTNFPLDYAPNANGIADITIRATDTGGLWVEDTFTVTVNPVHDPATVDSQIVSIDEDGTLSITFTAHDPDLPDVHTVGFRITDATDHGTLVPLGPVYHDGSGTYTQQFRFTPSANYSGADGFQFKFMEWTGFDSGTSFTGTFAASSVYLADLDNDGDDDVAMSSYNSDPWHAYNQIYLNDGNGNLTLRSTFGSYSWAIDLAIGDLNNDGNLDIIEANYWYAAQKVYWGDGTGLFTYGYTIASSVGNCQGVTLGDVDGDSDLDLVTASINGEANRLYLNNGTGTLTFQADLATGGNRWLSVQLGDVDNDGDLDVVFGSDNQASTVGLNDGNGNFSNWSYFGAVSDQTWDVRLGDVNNDTYLDVVAANWAAETKVYLGDGTGTFAFSSSLGSSTDLTRAVDLADLNHDGYLDLVEANNQNVNRAYLNDGTGSFIYYATIGSDVDNHAAIRVGDLDNDGAPDAVVGNWGGSPSKVYMGVSEASADATVSITVNPVNDVPIVPTPIPDVNVDEDAADSVFSLYPYFQDVEDADNQLVYTVEGNTNPSLFTSVSITDPTNFRLDYAADANGSAEITIRATDIGGLFVEDTFHVTVNPVNDDPTVQAAIPDVTVNEDAADTVFSLYPYFEDAENTDAQLAYTVTGNTNPSLFTLVSITDPTNFTLDYAPDANGSADITIRATDPGGLWVEDTFHVTVNAVNDAPTVVDQSGSLNEDGSLVITVTGSDADDPDVSLVTFEVTSPVTHGSLSAIGSVVKVSAGQYSQQFLYTPTPDYNGSDSFQCVMNTPGDSVWNGFSAGTAIGTDADRTCSVALGDVNGDGKLDVIAGNYGSTNKVYLGDGSGGFSAGTAIGTHTDSTYSVALGDVNGDGKLDVIAGNYGSTNKVYLGDGSGGFAAGTAIGTDGDLTWSVALGDVNADGKLDVIAGNDGQTNKVYLGDGSGGFAAGTAIGTDTDNTWSVALGDVNADGKLDVIAGNNGQTDKVYLGDGSGGFAAGTPVDPDCACVTYRVALGDVNADGNLDVIAGTPDYDKVYLGDGSGGYYGFSAGIPFGTYADYTFSVALEDVNGDGNLDVIAGNAGFRTSQVYLGNGTGDFSAVVGTAIGTDADNTWSVALGDVNADGNLDVIAGNYGSTNKVYLADLQEASAPGTVSITVNPVNDNPTVEASIPDVTVDEDAADTVFSLYPYFQDVEDADAQLAYTVTGNTNSSLFTSVSITDPNNFTLDYAPDANGTADMTIRATDTSGLWVEDTFTVTVNPVNDAPRLTSPIPDVVVAPDAPNTLFSLYPYFEDPEEADTQLTYTVVGNTNPGLFTSVDITDPTNFTLDYAPGALGTADITIRATDTVGLWVEDTFKVTTDVNEVPAVTVPGILQQSDASGAVIFNVTNGNLISVSDDAGTAPVQVTLTATHGTMTLNGVAGLTFDPGQDGTADATMTFTGTLVDINNALNGMSFNHDAGYYGLADVTVTVDDQGNTGSGGPETATSVANISVEPYDVWFTGFGTEAGWDVYNYTYGGCSYYTHDYAIYWQFVDASATWNFYNGTAWVGTDALGNAPYADGYGPYATWFLDTEPGGTYNGYEVYIHANGVTEFSLDHTAPGATYWQVTSAGEWSYFDGSAWYPTSGFNVEPVDVWFHGYDADAGWEVYNYPADGCSYYTHDYTVYWQFLDASGNWSFYNETAWVSTDALGNAPYDGGYGPPNQWFEATSGPYATYDVFIHTAGQATYFSLDYTAAGATFWQLTNTGAWSYWDGSAWYATADFNVEPADVWFHGYGPDAGWDVYNHAATGDEYFTHNQTVFWWHVATGDTWSYWNGTAWVPTTGRGIVA